MAIEKCRVVSGWLNVRQMPSNTSMIVAKLMRDDVIERVAVSDDGKWSGIKFQKGVAWVASRFLVKVAEPPPGEEFPWMAIAEGEKGVSEVPGMGNNPRVLEYLRATSGLGSAARSRDETPWCSAFVNWCLAQAGIPGTRSALARSWLDWGQPTEVPRQGCIVVFSRDVKFGHVGFYLGEIGTEIKVLGGNQHDAVTRIFQVSEKLYPKANLLGYRIPK